MKLNFKGFIAPAFAPFSRKTGELDLNIVTSKTYARYYLNNGVHGVLVNGTMGEGLCLSIQERKTVLEAWVEAAKNTPLHVMVQVGGVPLPHVHELAKHAESKGVHSLLCLPELYHRALNVDELVHYMTLVSKAAPKTPLVYYHNPNRTGVTYNMADFLKAASNKIPTLSGVKFGGDNLADASRCLRVYNGDITVMMANDHLLAASFFEGIESLNATTLNMFGPLITDMYKAVSNSQLSTARDKQRELSKAIDTITKHGKFIPTMKEAMNIMSGMDFGSVREPQGILNPDQVKQLKSDLETLNLAKTT